MSLRVNIDYGDEGGKGGPGVFVSREGETLASWNSGNPQDDWAAFIDWARERGEEVIYGTSLTETDLFHDLKQPRDEA